MDDRKKPSALSLATVARIVGLMLALVLAFYLRGRYAAFAERDRAITLCTHGHDSARAMCEREVDRSR